MGEEQGDREGISLQTLQTVSQRVFWENKIGLVHRQMKQCELKTLELRIKWESCKELTKIHEAYF